MSNQKQEREEIDLYLEQHAEYEFTKFTPYTKDTDENNIAIIDLGSNSIRLMIVSFFANKTPSIINQVKYMVRLGENSFQEKKLQEEPMRRTLDVIKAFAQSCMHYKVKEILPLATAAVRNAENGKEFVEKVAEETGINFKVISGVEEARLIYLGVSSSLRYNFGLRLFIDIGGGSTELIVGNSQRHVFLDSLNIGCVMLTNRFLANHAGKVSSELFKEMKNFATQVAAHAFQSIQNYKITEIVASSGTAQALYEISKRYCNVKTENESQRTLTLDELKQVSKYLCDLNLEDRTKLSGISKARAEVIIAGAAILLALLEASNAKKLYLTSNNLQHGVLADYLNQQDAKGLQSKTFLREQSIKALVNTFRLEKKHAEHVNALALMLHDSAVDCALISYDAAWREYLHYAALLHDIGTSISYNQHNVHGHYIITHAEPVGFIEQEKDFIGLLVYFHSKKPSRKNPLFMELNPRLRNLISIYSLFLALAENMDRLHRQHIYEAAFHVEDKELILYAQQFCPSLIEEFAVKNMQRAVEKVFGREVSIHFST